MGVWTDLPKDIVAIIAECLTVIDDFASFSVVSKGCQSVTASFKKKASLPPRYPRLMLAENENLPVRGFVNLLTSKTFGVELPEARGRYCVGAHYGWLFTLGSDLQINLLHPFSGQQVSLPPMLTFPDQYEYNEKMPPQVFLDFFVRKIAISANPIKGNNLNDECVIVAIYGEFATLAFARLGDTVWTNIEVSCVVRDVIYYKGKFYAVNTYGVILVCDIGDNDFPKATVVAKAPIRDPCYERQPYLVESSGDLFVVSRERVDRSYCEGEDDRDGDDNYCEGEDDRDGDDNYCEGEDDRDGDDNYNDKVFKSDYETTMFSVLRLDISHDEGSNNPYKFKEVTTLGGRSFFLGKNISASMASSGGIKENCIYFTDDDALFYAPEGGGRDTGIFNMEDGSIQFAYAGGSRSSLSPPIWYM